MANKFIDETGLDFFMLSSMSRLIANFIAGASLLLGVSGCGDCNQQQGETKVNDFRGLGPSGDYRFPSPPSTDSNITNYSLRFENDSSAVLSFRSGSKDYVLRYQVAIDGEYTVEKRRYAE